MGSKSPPERIAVEEPCHADWGTMTGTERRRFCGQCSKHVHDLSAMTAEEAAWLLSRETRPCIRFTPDAAGRPVYRDASRSRSAWPRAAMLLASVGLTVSSPALAASQTTEDVEPPAVVETVRGLIAEVIAEVRSWVEPPAVMGEMVPPEPPPQPPVLMGMLMREPEPPPPPAPPALPEAASPDTIPELEAATRR